MSGSEMPFLDHLSELRTKLWRIVVGLVAGTVVSFLWANWLFEALSFPILKNFQNVTLIGTGPADAFLTKILVSFASGVVLSAPNTFFQLWMFMLPGLHDNERKYALPFVLFSVLFFLIGISFCFFGVLPFAFKFFSEEFISIGLSPQIRISEYLSFIVKLLLVFGVMFELPIAIFIFGRLGILRHTQLREHFRIAIVAIFVIAAIVTPPDVFTQLMLAIPLCGLYYLCIYVCKYAEKLRSSSSTNSGSN